ncbi:MAG: TraB/GumN family protein [Woeseiaceae bacterium]|nr:TraB/GumN family protein [Woeseiaceae bacterium]MDX2608351.1 TraB/GumN family protein [Woeseiaceae bacterium]
MRRAICGLLLWLMSGSAFAGDQAHPVTLWRVAGESNSVYLLGSIHLLRKEDHPLPTVIGHAYDDADVVVMELDMDDMDPAYAQAAFNRAGVMTDGTTLRDLMGDEAYAQADQAAAQIDIPLDMLSQSEPWLAAMTVELMMLYRIGFNPLLGVEMTITQRATSDGKPIEGLETIDEQLSFLDGLPIEAQREMLLQVLTEGAAMSEQIDDLIQAWHHGDTAALAEGLLNSIGKQDELNEVLVDSRNRRWASVIATWLDDEQDYLVVVGALHLVGANGVPALLENRGFGIHQLSEPASLR